MYIIKVSRKQGLCSASAKYFWRVYAVGGVYRVGLEAEVGFLSGIAVFGCVWEVEFAENSRRKQPFGMPCRQRRNHSFYDIVVQQAIQMESGRLTQPNAFLRRNDADKRTIKRIQIGRDNHICGRLLHIVASRMQCVR